MESKWNYYIYCKEKVKILWTKGNCYNGHMSMWCLNVIIFLSYCKLIKWRCLSAGLLSLFINHLNYYGMDLGVSRIGHINCRKWVQAKQNLPARKKSTRNLTSLSTLSYRGLWDLLVAISGTLSVFKAKGDDRRRDSWRFVCSQFSVFVSRCCDAP